MNLPDSIIAATAYFLNMPLMTAGKTFNKVNEIDVLF